MDTGVRDLEQIQEREDGPGGSGRKVAMLAVAALATVALVFAMGMVLGDASAEPPPDAEDPLAVLDRAAGLAPERDDRTQEEDAPSVDRRDLTFPHALSDDERPEVAAALAAAAAELAHPDPIARAADERGPSDDLAAPSDGADPLLPIAAGVLPGGVTAAGSGSQLLARTAPHDPLVASAIPRRSPGGGAPHGREGEYTLQIISYRTPEEANAFADALRARNHRAFVVSADIPDRGRYFRVRVGPFQTLREAEEYRASFEDAEHMSTYVVKRQD